MHNIELVTHLLNATTTLFRLSDWCLREKNEILYKRYLLGMLMTLLLLDVNIL